MVSCMVYLCYCNITAPVNYHAPPGIMSETSVQTPDTSTRSHSSNRAQRSDSVPSKLDTEPTLAELSHYTTKSGETVEIILSLAPKWQEFATVLNFDADGRQLRLFQAERHTKAVVMSSATGLQGMVSIPVLEPRLGPWKI